MSSGSMICRRINVSELESWIQSAWTHTNQPPNVQSQVWQLASQADSVVYVANVEDRMIGGTWLWRDKRRLGLTLAEMWMNKEFRSKAMNQLVKSSLPWFKSLAIREVDALVYLQEASRPLKFPYNPVMESWISPFLENNDFTEAGIYSQSLISIETKPQVGYPLSINETPDIEWVRNTLWEQREFLGLDLSPPEMMCEYANELESLFTFSKDGNTVLAMTRYTMGENTVIGPILYDSDLDVSTIVSTILGSISKGSNTIFLSLISSSQDAILQSVAEFGQSQVSEMRLLRRTY